MITFMESPSSYRCSKQMENLIRGDEMTTPADGADAGPDGGAGADIIEDENSSSSAAAASALDECMVWRIVQKIRPVCKK